MPFNPTRPSSAWRVTRLALIAIVGAVSSVTAGLGAQDVAKPERPIPVSPREHMVTDPAGYARYARPSQCAQAAQRAYNFYWRTRRIDTVAVVPSLDSVPAPVVAVAKACGAQFQGRDLSPDDLIGLTQLYLWSRDYEHARATADRVVTKIATRGAEERGAMLFRLVFAFYRSKPIRSQEASVYLAQLEKLGTPAAYWRMNAQFLWMRNYQTENELAQSLASSAAGVRAGSQMSRANRVDDAYDLVQAYGATADVAYLAKGSPAALAVIDSGTADVLSTRERGSQGYMMMQGNMEQLKTIYPYYAQPAPTIQAQHWFNAGGDTLPRPRPGKVTVIVFLQPNCGSQCYASYSIIRRLYASYAASGVDFVFVANTAGYFRTQLEEKPDDEADLIRHYFLDYLKLPGTLVVNETQFSHKRDGRRINEADVNQRQYPPGRDIVIVGRDGKMNYAGPLLLFAYEKTIRAQIERALAAPR